jgi:hypothetical protein
MARELRYGQPLEFTQSQWDGLGSGSVFTGQLTYWVHGYMDSPGQHSQPRQLLLFVVAGLVRRFQALRFHNRLDIKPKGH